MTKALCVAIACAFAPLPALAGTVDIPPEGLFGEFTPGEGGDVFNIDAGSFGVTAPLVFQSGVFGDPGLSNVGADDPKAIDPNANVIVIQNRDNDDADGPPSNWNASWNARTSLEAIAANTEGDRPGFFVYWNEGLGVERLFATENLNDPLGSLQRLFTVQSETLSGVPGEFDLNLFDGSEPTRTDLFGEANANLADLANYNASNFAFSDQIAPVPLPAALPLMVVALGGLAMVARRKTSS